MTEQDVFNAYLNRHEDKKYIFSSVDDDYDGTINIYHSREGKNFRCIASWRDVFDFVLESIPFMPQSGWETITFRWVDGCDRMPTVSGTYEWRERSEHGIMDFDAESGEWERSLTPAGFSIRWDTFFWKEIREPA
jgi:hypothetical protein